MSKAHTIHQVYLANSLPHLTLDDMLATQGLSHSKYRRWLKENDKPLYPLTEGLCQEVLAVCSHSRQQLSAQFNLDMREVDACLYADSPGRGLDPMKKERAALLRRSGCTEFDIISRNLPPDMEVLSLEITERRSRGDSVAYLAQLYNYTVGRISQLDKSSSKKPRLTPQAKEEIKVSTATAATLAKKYNTTINTIYVIKRAK